ncbi:unnamed protein product [Brachionus calyciflorus]|uniref:Endonuclease/exonuclease/phosphatase domain-containing protein n=1 Tax=Brachionus calyciflorus TaxID=104777 RepID=A0A814M3A3_9BILA|nr:unnamed protein product [Brachionus calyciflorus]
MGDWNADLERCRRFDIIFKDFVYNNDLIISDDSDSQKVGYTYRNSDYKALIDHINWHKNDDHLPITIKVDVDLGVKDEFNQVITKFHRFDWNCSVFIDKNNENLEKMMPEMEHYFTKEPNLELINQFYKELCSTLIRARTAERSIESTSIIKNISTIRKNWNVKKLTTQLKEINQKVKLVESNLKNSVGIVRKQLEDDLRNLGLERRIEINKVYDYPVPEFQVKSAINNRKSNKAVGHDNIPAEMLKHSKSTSLMVVLRKFYTIIFNYGIVLDDFNVSIVTPIP